jgi:hypothetical protein
LGISNAITAFFTGFCSLASFTDPVIFASWAFEEKEKKAMVIKKV